MLYLLCLLATHGLAATGKFCFSPPKQRRRHPGNTQEGNCVQHGHLISCALFVLWLRLNLAVHEIIIASKVLHT